MAWNLDCASDSDRADFTDPATRGAANIYARRLKPGRLSQPGHCHVWNWYEYTASRDVP
jgi:hypothetical protein